MRIIAGAAKGRSLKVPGGTSTRPSTDLVRSAVFSILESMQLDWSAVLDLYAGSGALGLEALSRGAARADFVDQDRRSCTVIKQNLGHIGFADRAHVYCSRAASALSFLKGEYGIVFLDPPYADSSLPEMLRQLAASHLVGKGSAIAVLHSRRRPLEDCYGGFCRVKQRRYGDTGISVYVQEAST